MTLKRVARRIKNPQVPVPQVLRKCLVVSVDDAYTCTVLLDGEGDSIPGVGLLDHYTLVADDWVWVLTTPGLWVIVGRIP